MVRVVQKLDAVRLAQAQRLASDSLPISLEQASMLAEPRWMNRARGTAWS